MSNATMEETRTSASGTQHDSPARRRAKGRAATIVVLIVALIGSSLFQDAAYSYRDEAVNGQRKRTAKAGQNQRGTNLDSFALGLLLGGLRGPLVMYLWTSSETQKTDRDLESFETKVELIRLLQPEFASVHLFQMWNLGYNISVQMASLANKYSCILAAIEYGQRTDREDLPNNINILSQIGSLYGDKLGGSTEKAYYVRRVRTETLPVYRVTIPPADVEKYKAAAMEAGLDAAKLRLTTPASGPATAMIEKIPGDKVKSLLASSAGIKFEAIKRQDLRPAQQSGRRSEMDTLVDVNGKLLPPGESGIERAELEHLEPLQPYPYGIPPQALAYNYYKRAQILQTVGKQRHLQISEMVIDRQPAIGLKFWAEEEWLRGRRLETEAILTPTDLEAKYKEFKEYASAPEDTKRATGYGLMTGAVKADAPMQRKESAEAAIFSFERSAKVAAMALTEYERHLQQFTSNLQNYMSHMDHMRMVGAISAGDAKYLRAMIAPASDQARLLADAKADYENAEKWAIVLMLKYFVEDIDAQLVPFARASVDQRSLADLRDLLARTEAKLKQKYKKLEDSQGASDRDEYAQSLKRIQQRVKIIGG